PVLPSPGRPFTLCAHGLLDGCPDLVIPRSVPFREYMLVIVRLDDLTQVTGPDFFSADDQRDLYTLTSNPVERLLQLPPLLAARSVVENRLVQKRGCVGDAAHPLPPSTLPG